MNPLQEMIHTGAGAQAIADYLDSLSHASRRRLTEGLAPRDMRALFDLVDGAHPLDMTHFVPEGTPEMTEVIHWGKNTLPAFTTFQKRFCRPHDDEGNLWGYNENPAHVHAAIGPGYFVARPGSLDTPVWIDYHLTPPRKPAHWPRIQPSGARFGLFVYHNTIDKMRKVSHHVSIGSAWRWERPLGAFFTLCRQD